MADVTTPHLAYPFRFQTVGGVVSAAVVEQDTIDEVMACVQAIVACPIGFRDELPPFGIPEPEFRQVPIDPAPIQASVGRWEPRADTSSEEFADASSTAWRHVQLDVALQNGTSAT